MKVIEKWMCPVEGDQRGKHIKLAVTGLSVAPNVHLSSCIIYAAHLPRSVSPPFFILLSLRLSHTDSKGDREITVLVVILELLFLLEGINFEKFGWNRNCSS